MDDWIRTPPTRRLLWAALVLSLVLGVVLVVVDRQEAGAADQVGVALTDEQAVEQVVGSARKIVAAARLRDAAGSYSFVPCETESGPPYQAALYMSFTLLQRDWVRYLNEVASAMIADGWTDAPTKAEHFGRKLTGGGVTAVLQRNLDVPGNATMRLYGECRNISDHRNDDPAWTEVSL
ncbi:hypothetical protein [Mycobacterium neglectum]|jgi:hypothetical protein|uniref:hypothetical protein n=1 Tax=Mycobacterium neglectum TaxID=242737 RepID=UPI000BFEE9F8|nr:hypothetical protein [Mycobacterium neglectum]